MDDLKTMVDEGWEIRQRHFESTICFSYPSQTRAVSVTGDKCQLNRAHCGGHYLKHMKALQEERGSVRCCHRTETVSFLAQGPGTWSKADKRYSDTAGTADAR